MSTLKRIFCIGGGISLLFFQAIEWKVAGIFLIIWFILDVIGDNNPTIRNIKNILGIVIGSVLVVFGAIVAIQDKDYIFLGALFIVFGLVVVLQFIFQFNQDKAGLRIENILSKFTKSQNNPQEPEE